MNLYIKISILLLILYILFIYKGDKTIENMDIYNYYSQYRLNNYDFNDLNLEKSKRFYPINYGSNDAYNKSAYYSSKNKRPMGIYFKLNKKKIKYLKAVNISFDEIRNEINNNGIIEYSPKGQISYKVSNNSKAFDYIFEYLIDRLNIMSRNLYNITFNKILDVSGYQTNTQMTIEMLFQLSIKIRKEGFGDTTDTHVFNVKSSFIINKINIDEKKMINVFIRTLFIDDKIVNDYMQYNV
jgi:hypothetical protein